ncbi:MAG: hypothetical protein Q8N81_03925 [bacterium]|nr:hypothetical protein [bacterium]
MAWSKRKFLRNAQERSCVITAISLPGAEISIFLRLAMWDGLEPFPQALFEEVYYRAQQRADETRAPVTLYFDSADMTEDVRVFKPWIFKPPEYNNASPCTYKCAWCANSAEHLRSHLVDDNDFNSEPSIELGELGRWTVSPVAELELVPACGVHKSRLGRPATS